MSIKSTMKGGREDVDKPFWSWDTWLSRACWPRESLSPRKITFSERNIFLRGFRRSLLFTPKASLGNLHPSSRPSGLPRGAYFSKHPSSRQCINPIYLTIHICCQVWMHVRVAHTTQAKTYILAQVHFLPLQNKHLENTLNWRKNS